MLSTDDLRSITDAVDSLRTIWRDAYQYKGTLYIAGDPEQIRQDFIAAVDDLQRVIGAQPE